MATKSIREGKPSDLYLQESLVKYRETRGERIIVGVVGDSVSLPNTRDPST